MFFFTGGFFFAASGKGPSGKNKPEESDPERAAARFRHRNGENCERIKAARR
jgi:hypothetical protein